MQTVNSDEIIEGVFVRELKNRFLCEVQIASHLAVCYVPSSCHLSNFLNLSGKRVLLLPNKSKGTRTEMSLFAIPYKRSYIVLNTSLANRAVESSIRQRRFSFLGKRRNIKKELTLEGYKWDLFVEDTMTHVEIKSIISTEESASFPTVYSERTLKQLSQIEKLLSSGKRICFLIISLNPYTREICVDKSSDFYTRLNICLEKGLVLKGYTIRFKRTELVVDREIPIVAR